MLALKGNQGTLHREVRSYFEQGRKRRWQAMPVAYAETYDLGHGRREVRRLWISTDTEWLPKRETWVDLSSIVMIEHERHTQSGMSLAQRFFISSLAVEPHEMLRIIRGHWGIENRLHWQLDVTFGEDASRIRKDHGPQNFSTLRRTALSLLKQDTTCKTGIAIKRQNAGWDDDSREKVLRGATV